MNIIAFADECISCGDNRFVSSPAILMPFIAKRIFGYEPIEITDQWGMRDLKKGVSYFPALSLQCTICGTLFLNYRFTEEQMSLLYADYRGAEYTSQREFYEPGYAIGAAKDFQKRHAYIKNVETWLLPRLPAKPTILDYGGGDGMNSLFLGEGEVYISDISNVPLVAGAKQMEPSNANRVNFDLITICQVLEHVPHPEHVLSAIKMHLRPNTLLYTEVPFEKLMSEHIGHLNLAAKKRYWHEHINFFSEKGLVSLLERCGLKAIEVKYFNFNNGFRSGNILGVLSHAA